VPRGEIAEDRAGTASVVLNVATAKRNQVKLGGS
jgi:hypothetical protein